MGVPTQSSLTARAARLRHDRAGLALPTALFALVTVSLLCLGLFQMTDLETKASRNRERAARAMHLAEAGAAHALAVLRANLKDTSMTRLLQGASPGNTSDDGYLDGYGLADALRIPQGGRATAAGSYYVRLLDDPADTDGNPKTDANRRITARCKGATTDGAVAELDVIIALVTLPSVAVDGSVTINGNPDLIGVCGGAHANQVVLVSGNLEVTGRITATNTVVIQGGTIVDTLNNPVVPLHHQPPQEIPALDPTDYCSSADYILQANGWIRRVADGRLFDATGSGQFGFMRISTSPLVWDQAGGSPPDGATFCVEGNVQLGSNLGSASTPLEISIIATGDIMVSGNAHITAHHPDGIMLMAGGDVQFSGNPDATSENYSGLIYAGAQCMISGNPRINGQLVCKDSTPDPPGATLINVTGNQISGNPEIRYDCAGNLLARRRVLFWYPRVGN